MIFLICPATNFLVDGGSVTAARRGQRGGSVGSAAVVAAERWQHGGGSAVAAAPRQHRGGGGSVAAAARRWAEWWQCRPVRQ